MKITEVGKPIVTAPKAYWWSYFVDSSMGKAGFVTGIQSALNFLNDWRAWREGNRQGLPDGAVFAPEGIQIRLAFSGHVRQYLQEMSQEPETAPQITLVVGLSENPDELLRYPLFASELLDFLPPGENHRAFSVEEVGLENCEVGHRDPFPLKVSMSSGLLEELKRTEGNCIGEMKERAENHDGHAEIMVCLLGTEKREPEVKEDE